MKMLPFCNKKHEGEEKFEETAINKASVNRTGVCDPIGTTQRRKIMKQN